MSEVMTKPTIRNEAMDMPSFERSDTSSVDPKESILGESFSNIGAIQIIHDDKTLYLSADYLIDYKLYKEYMVGYEPLSLVELNDIIRDLFTFARVSVSMFESKTGQLIGSAISHLIYEAEQVFGLRLDAHSMHKNLLTIDLTRFTTKELPDDDDWLGLYENWPDFLIFKDGASNAMRVINVNRFHMSFAKWLQTNKTGGFSTDELAIIQNLVHVDEEDSVITDDELRGLHQIMPFIIKNKLFTIHDEGTVKGKERLSWVVCSGCMQSHVLRDTVGCKTMGFATEGATLKSTCPSMALTRID